MNDPRRPSPGGGGYSEEIMGWSKINAFCIDKDERWMFAGDASGRIRTVGLEALDVQGEAQAHGGTISALAAHPSLPLIAALGMDQFASIWRYDEAGRLTKLHDIPVRAIACGNDAEEYRPVLSESQAIGFHSSKRQLVTRSGSGGLLEIAFDEAGWKVLRCTRLHPMFDLVTARYLVGSDRVAAGMTRGVAVLLEEGKILRQWRFGDESVHWFEHLRDETYLVASDSRRVIRLDFSGASEPLEGAPFALDDFEHVTRNRVSGRVFASSFDRNVYEIDPETCAKTALIYAAPFKNRWIKTLEREPDTLYVQCRNGGLYKVDLRTGLAVAVLKETPDALWSAARTPEDTLLLAGEGAHFLELAPKRAEDPHARKTSFSARRRPLDAASATYTKRLAVHEKLGTAAFARTDGEILLGNGGRVERLMKLDYAVRDLAFHPAEPWLFASCEDGRVLKIDCRSRATLAEHRSPLPVWAIAYNPEKDLLAVSERMGELVFLDGTTLARKGVGSKHRFAKRMKWIDGDRLLYNISAGLYRHDLRTGTAEELIPTQGNTLEDFTWDAGRRYLAFISYTRNVALCDFETGSLLSVVPDQVDYSKGIFWLNGGLSRSGNPYEFVTFGRTGVASLYQVHDGRILSLGPVAADAH